MASTIGNHSPGRRLKHEGGPIFGSAYLFALQLQPGKADGVRGDDLGVPHETYIREHEDPRRALLLCDRPHVVPAADHSLAG